MSLRPGRNRTDAQMSPQAIDRKPRSQPPVTDKSYVPNYGADGIILVNGKPAWYMVNEFDRTTISMGKSDPFIAKKEYGAVLAFEFHFDRKQVGMMVDIKGRAGTIIHINDKLIIDLVRLGRGITPGEVKTLPDGTSPDPVCTPLDFYPYIARYKDTAETDAIGDFGAGFVMRYEPRYPIEYKDLTAWFNNPSGSDCLLVSGSFTRAVFLDEGEMTEYGFNRI